MSILASGGAAGEHFQGDMVGGKGLKSTPRVSGMWHRSGFGKASWTGRGPEAGAHGAWAERAVLSCCVSLGAAPSGAP